MPKFSDIIENWKLGVWSFLIIAAAIIIFWGLLFIFNQHHRMKAPRARIIIAGCGFIGFLFCWFFLTGLARFGREISDMRNSAVERESRGLSAGLIFAGKSVQGTLTNYDNSIITSSGVSVTPENRTIGSGADVIIVLHVSNSGLPTTAFNYKSYINLKGQDGKDHEMDASIPSIAVQTNQTIPTIVGPIKITKENFLLDALSFTPLASGAAGNYWLLIHINGIIEIPTGTHLVISFEDVFGRETKVDYVWTPGL